MRLGILGASLMCTLALAGCAGKGGTAARNLPPPPQNATEYYPLVPGWKWAYEVQKGTETVLATYAVLERLGETVFVQTGEERIGYAVLPEGIARRGSLEVGDFVLKSPVRQGATWPVSDGQARVVAVGQTVTVPGGTFDNCATVEETRTNPDRVTRTTFAPSIGPVAIELQVSDPASGRFGTQLRATLRGVTRPGEDPLGPSSP